jgi:hypothetical protein
MKAGYSKEAAERIVAREKARAAAGYPPYGTTIERPPATHHSPETPAELVADAQAKLNEANAALAASEDVK